MRRIKASARRREDPHTEDYLTRWVEAEILSTPLEEVPQRNTAVLKSNEAWTIEAVRQRMRAARTGVASFVLDDGELDGIFTERDLIQVDPRCDWVTESIHSTIRRPVKYAGTGGNIGGFVWTVMVHGYRQVPWVNSRLQPTGLISARNLLRFIYQNFSRESTFTEFLMRKPLFEMIPAEIRDAELKKQRPVSVDNEDYELERLFWLEAQADQQHTESTAPSPINICHKFHLREPIQITLGAGSSAADVADLMRNENVGTVLVVDGWGRIAGIISERDFINRIDSLTAKHKLDDIGAMSLMTEAPMTLGINQSLYTALRFMALYNFRHVPIVDRDHRPITVFSVRDVFDELFGTIAERMFEESTKQQYAEFAARSEHLSRAA